MNGYPAITTRRLTPGQRKGPRAVAFVLILALGLNWMSVQWLAWSYMVLKYAQTASLGNAISMTLDGEHPCSLCKIAQAAQQSERDQDRQIPPTKPDWAKTPTPQWLFAPPYRLLTFSSISCWGDPRFLAPPKPPPRDA